MKKLDLLRAELGYIIGSTAADAAIKSWKSAWETAQAREDEEADDAGGFDAYAVGQTHLLQSILASDPVLGRREEGEGSKAVAIVVEAETEVTR
jgi:hypothetical protein